MTRQQRLPAALNMSYTTNVKFPSSFRCLCPVPNVIYDRMRYRCVTFLQTVWPEHLSVYYQTIYHFA